MYTFYMGTPPTPCKCIQSVWAPLPHVNVYILMVWEGHQCRIYTLTWCGRGAHAEYIYLHGLRGAPMQTVYIYMVWEGRPCRMYTFTWCVRGAHAEYIHLHGVGGVSMQNVYIYVWEGRPYRMYTFSMDTPPTPCKCIYSAWAPLTHHVNVYILYGRPSHT